MAQKRIQKEYAELIANPIPDVVISPQETNIAIWDVILKGPIKSPYKGGTFKLKVEFPTEYPFKSPKIKFLTQIYHPNVDKDGGICLDAIKPDSWKPATKIVSVLHSIITLLNEPNLADPLVPEIANIYMNDRAQFDKKAAEWTEKYAKST